MDADGVTTAMAYEGNEVIENGQRRMLLFDGGYVDFSGSEPRYLWYTKDHLGSVRAVSDTAGIVLSAYAYGPYGEDFAGEEEVESGQVDPDPLTINGMNPNLENMPIYPGGTVQSPVSSMSIPGAESEFEEEEDREEPPVIYSAPAAPTWQPYRFSGKESLTRVGLPLYDFGARMYSPSNTRWMTIDPLAEKYYHISPYVYCAGNPVNLVDPDGRSWYYSFVDGSFVSHIDDDDDKIYMLSQEQIDAANGDTEMMQGYRSDENEFGLLALLDNGIDLDVATSVISDLFDRANRTEEDGNESYIAKPEIVLFADYNGPEASSTLKTLNVNLKAGLFNGYDVINLFAHEIGHTIDRNRGRVLEKMTAKQRESSADRFAKYHWSNEKISDYRRNLNIQHGKSLGYNWNEL